MAEIKKRNWLLALAAVLSQLFMPIGAMSILLTATRHVSAPLLTPIVFYVGGLVLVALVGVYQKQRLASLKSAVILTIIGVFWAVVILAVASRSAIAIAVVAFFAVLVSCIQFYSAKHRGRRQL